MRTPRIKLKNQPATYHCISRVVGNEHLLTDSCKEVMRSQLRKTAYFCGIKLLSYCIMSNHFHVLVKVAPQGKINDSLLIDRVKKLYGKNSDQYQATRGILSNKDTSEDALKAKEQIRSALIKRMGDLSEFMKTFKQRFSIWYNKNHKRCGTLWMERFKSILVESKPHSLITTAAYIDLNPIRAGIVEDPINYRFCSYSDASHGVQEAKEGIMSIIPLQSWSKVSAKYRMFLFEKGSRKEKENQATINTDTAKRVIEIEKGNLPISAILRNHIKHFTDGVVLGSENFVREITNQFVNILPTGYKKKNKRKPVCFLKSLDCSETISAMRPTRRKSY